MNYAVYNIALDIHKTGSQVALSMIRGENKRKIVISLMENGRPYKIADGCSAVLTAVKPDEKFIYNECDIDFKNNLIIYNVTSQTTAAMGEVKCQIKLIGVDSGLLFSPTFSLIVADTLYNEEPILASSEEFNALTAYLADLQKKLADGEFKGEKGDKGDTGDRGPQGVRGEIGPAGKDADASSLSPAVVCTATGTAIAISDSSESGFEAFSIYGKSTQNGTPTPEAPVDIVSVGDKGNIEINEYGSNLLSKFSSETKNGVTLTVNSDGSLLFNGTCTEDNTCFNGKTRLFKGTYLAKLQSLSGTISPVGNNGFQSQKYNFWINLKEGGQRSFTLTQTLEETWAGIRVDKGTVFNNYKVQVYIQSDNIKNANYEVYKSSSIFNLTTPNGLLGIPITDSSLATYTDANGQMWCADEIDLDRGVYVQRIQKFIPELNNGGVFYSLGTHARTSLNFTEGVSVSTPNGLCNITSMVGDYTLDKVHFYAQNTQLWLFAPISELAESSGKAIVNWFVNNGAEFYYILATPIETPLTSEQIAQYKALKTNYPSTTVVNDENAFMKVGYRADTKKFIEKFAGSTTQISSVTLAASKWVGTASPYSQVVTIQGATKNSKININPTVEQLNIFHNKDIAFVVGNNNGVITVYCIGQKPANDYTMQVSITEVNKI